MVIEFRYGKRAWLARDKSIILGKPGTLYLYYKKPEKGKKYWLSNGFRKMMPNRDDFSQVKWEDDEPTEVEIIDEQ